MTTSTERAAQPWVGRVEDPAEYLELERLYREVFGIRQGSGSINARWLHALDRNSGIVVVARDERRLLGFACSFLSIDQASNRLYQYSQTAAVLQEAQGRGVGRALKMAQRRDSLAAGVDLMRWTFDPLRARNAHFNFDVLGGRSRSLIRNFYGDAAHGRDEGDRTDRLLVEWELAREPAAEPIDLLPADELPALGDAAYRGGRAYVAIPADWERARVELGIARALQLRAAIAGELERGLSAGLTLTSCLRRDTELAYYVLSAENDQRGYN